jgi:glycosyltransferase involved in cell wall biosynthesis
MRLLFVQETDWLKRNPAQQHHLAEMLSLRGHEVCAIDYELLWRTRGKKELYSRREVFENVTKVHQGASIKVIRPGIVKLPLLEYVSLIFSHRGEIRRQVREFQPDAVVGWGILNSYLAMKAARRNGLPFIYYWIDVLERLIPAQPFQTLGKLVERETLKYSDRILAINDKLRDYLIRLGAAPERTQVLRAGIDIKRFNPNSNGVGIRQQYGLRKEDVVLFFMGWLYHFSGLKEVALELSGTNNANLKFLVVGEGDALEELRRIQEKHNLADRLILTGKKNYEEIPDFLAAADICLLPACPDEKIMQDVVPIKMYEYMAMRKPVIATRLAGVMKEFGEDNGVVYVDRPEDVIPKALELVNNGKLNQLGEKARSLVEGYSWDQITDQFEMILEETIKEKKHGAVSGQVPG